MKTDAPGRAPDVSYGRPGARFLVAYHAPTYCGFNDAILDWVAVNVPEGRARFDLRRLPCRLAPDGSHALVLPWLQDPVEGWSPRTYRHAMALTAECDRRGVPVLNRVERLARAGRLSGAALIRAAGLRTPRVERIDDVRRFRRDLCGVPLPLFVREDGGHQGRMLRADTPDQARRLPLERFRAPVAIELVDLADARDRLYRKYRYLVAGDRGVPHHVQASATWVTRGRDRVVTDATRAGELDYIESPSTHHDRFQRARHALGLDVVAFDYAIDADGEPVVWEANPYPFLQFSRRGLAYRNDALHRSIAILVALYFERAGLAMPGGLADAISACPSILPSGGGAPLPRAPAAWRVPPPRSGLERAGRVLQKAARRLYGGGM